MDADDNKPELHVNPSSTDSLLNSSVSDFNVKCIKYGV